MDQRGILTIDKELELGQYDLPAITYEVSSDGDTPFRVRLKQQLPEDLDPTDVRFKPADTDAWRVSGRTVVFERRMDAEETLFTLFAVQTDTPERLHRVSAEPVVEVQPADSGGEGDEEDWTTVPEEHVEVRGIEPADRRSAFVYDGGRRQPRADGSPTPPEPGVSDSEAEDTGSSQNNIEAAIPSVDDRETAHTEVASSTTEPVPTEPGRQSQETTGTSGRLVDEFITALREESVSEAQRQTLREAVGLDSSESTNARIEHCQARLSDLSAYIDALEEFLDEKGTGQQLIEDVQSDLDAVEDRMRSLESELETAANEREELRDRIDRIEGQLSTVQDWRETVTGAFAGSTETDTDEG